MQVYTKGLRIYLHSHSLNHSNVYFSYTQITVQFLNHPPFPFKWRMNLSLNPTLRQRGRKSVTNERRRTTIPTYVLPAIQQTARTSSGQKVEVNRLDLSPCNGNLEHEYLLTLTLTILGYNTLLLSMIYCPGGQIQDGSYWSFCMSLTRVGRVQLITIN